MNIYEEESLPPRIEAAFADVPYPGDDRLVPEPYQNHWEAGEIAQEFAGQHWKDMPLDVLSSNLECFNYFTPEAVHYYLPAYLLAALKTLGPAEAGTRAADIPASLAYHLTPTKQAGLRRDDFLDRVSRLTLEQKLVIRDVFRWLDQRAKEWEQEHLPEHAQGISEEDEDDIALREYGESLE